jgi:hypothetical protein
MDMLGEGEQAQPMAAECHFLSVLYAFQMALNPNLEKFFGWK